MNSKIVIYVGKGYLSKCPEYFSKLVGLLRSRIVNLERD